MLVDSKQGRYNSKLPEIRNRLSKKKGKEEKEKLKEKLKQKMKKERLDNNNTYEIRLFLLEKEVVYHCNSVWEKLFNFIFHLPTFWIKIKSKMRFYQFLKFY